MKTKTKKPVVTLSQSVAQEAISNAVNASIKGGTACAECADVLSKIVPNWARFDGRSARTPESMKKHCSDLGITIAQGTEVKAWLKQMWDEHKEKYSAMLTERGATVVDEQVKAACYAFIQSIKRNCSAYFDGKAASGKQAGKGRGKAKAAAPKAKAKAKNKAAPKEKEKTLAEIYGASPKALQAGMAGVISGFDYLMEARGTKGLPVDSLDRARLLVEQACEIVGKMPK